MDGLDITLSPEDFKLIRDLIDEHSGIRLPDYTHFIVERRLRPRLLALEVNGFREYYRHLKYGREIELEMAEIIERITTNETYFYRESYQLEAFANEVVPDLLEQRASVGMSTELAPIRIWSAGCSTGEEPYTLAMVMNEKYGESRVKYEILGNDISRNAIDRANDGLYREASFREIEPDLREKYFDSKKNKTQIRDFIRKNVRFRFGNLMSPETLTGYNYMDVIFCRNVMIYFSKESRKKVLDTFYERLRPGGYLLLGHSETIDSSKCKFEFVPLETCLVYRKPRAHEDFGST
mgnify:CR=1 FL=1